MLTPLNLGLSGVALIVLAIVFQIVSSHLSGANGSYRDLFTFMYVMVPGVVIGGLTVIGSILWAIFR